MAEFILTRASSGISKDYAKSTSISSKEYVELNFIPQTLMDMMINDSVLFTATTLTGDLISYNGYDFLGKNTKEIEKARKLFNETLDFDRVIKNVILQLLVYGNSYLEIVWNKSKTEVKELHPLEGSEMKIKFDEHGEIEGYIQKVEGKSPKKYPKFAKDNVIFFRLYWIGSDVYGKAPYTAIARPYATKMRANSYLNDIFTNLPPKIVYFLKNANTTQKAEFLENVLRAKTNPGTDIIAQGEAYDSKVMEPTFDDGLVKILEYLRKEVLMIMRVPPHWIGDLTGANRGIGESVVIPYESKIKTLQAEIASQINRELMPKLGLSNLKFRWNAISLMDEKSIVENMTSLQTQGFDGETVIQYGRDHGFNLRKGAKIETPPESKGAPQILGKENLKTDKMKQGIDKNGVSAAGKKKLDAKKVM